MGREVCISLLLGVDNAESSDDYTLQVYCSGQRPQTVKFHNATFSTELSLQIHSSPNYVHFWLYVLDGDSDSDGATTELSLGSSCVTLASLLGAYDYIQVPLLDINRASQATLSVRPTRPEGIPNWAKVLPKTPTLLPHADHLSDIVSWTRKAYQGLRCHEDLQHFETINTHVGDVPIVCFPLLSTLYAEQQKKDGERFLIHVLQLGCQLRDIPLDKIDSLKPVDAGNLLGEVCCWLPRCLLYVADFTRTRDPGQVGIRKSLTDEWSILGDFPNLGRAGFDCEDGSCFVLAVLHLLNVIQTSYPPLQAFQRIRRRYNAFFALGQLYDGQHTDGRAKYVAHAFVVALDRQYVRSAMLGLSAPSSSHKYCPALAIESTNWTESVWCSNYWKTDRCKSRIALFHRADRLFDLTQGSPQSTEKWKRMIKCCIPSAVLHSHKMYGDVAMMVSTDVDGVLQTLMLGQDGQSVGISVNELLLQTRPSRVSRTVLYTTNPKDIAKLEESLSEMPRAQLPNIPPEWLQAQHDHAMSNPPNSDISERSLRYTMRTEDYQKNQTEVHELFARLEPRLGHNRISAEQNVTPDASFTMFQVEV